ncbi:hypothetical protein A2U01_0063008, partial [Trifolium medium]|nr:hypothetical protein [Trifolium medium]
MCVAWTSMGSVNMKPGVLRLSKWTNAKADACTLFEIANAI